MDAMRRTIKRVTRRFIVLLAGTLLVTGWSGALAPSADAASTVCTVAVGYTAVHGANYLLTYPSAGGTHFYISIEWIYPPRIEDPNQTGSADQYTTGGDSFGETPFVRALSGSAGGDVWGTYLCLDARPDRLYLAIGH